MKEGKPSRSQKHKLQVSFNHIDGEVTLRGLKHDEVDMFLKMLEGAGHTIGTAKQTRITFVSRFEELPCKVTDKEMLPFWKKPETSIEVAGPVQLRFPFMFDTGGKGERVGLYVHDICGYRYTEKGYCKAAKLLERCGFECLRSKRDSKKGTFTEVWHLPDIERAKGVLGFELLYYITATDKLRKAIDFLTVNVEPKRIDAVRR